MGTLIRALVRVAGPPLREEPMLVVRLAATSIGRSAMTLTVIEMTNEFLAIAHGQPGRVAGTLFMHLGPRGASIAVAFVLLAAFIGSAVLNFDFRVAQQKITRSVELGLMDRLVAKLLALSVPFCERRSPGDIVETVRTDVTQVRLVLRAVTGIVFDTLHLTGLAAAALIVSPRLTFFAAIFFPLVVWPIITLSRRILARSYRVRQRSYALFDIVAQILGGARIVRVFRGDALERARAREAGTLYFDEQVAIVRMRAIAMVALESTAGLAIMAAIVAGGIEVSANRLEWPALVAFILALRSLQAPLGSINEQYLETRAYSASLDRVQQLLAETPVVEDKIDARPLERAPRRIEFDDVSFSYSRGKVLEGVHLCVNAGETIGIVGPSGSGKTTLLNLIARFYDPSTGRILLDGRDMRDVPLADLYRQLAIVTQEPFLFAATVRDNIRYGRPSATDSDVEMAARAAYVHDEIAALPKGYDTVVGIGGEKLSLGQQQRVNVARAILKDAPILLLDEATSALDSVAEREVQRAIERLMKGRTSFVIAHRLSTLRNASRIVVIDKGRVVATGTHKEVVTSCNVYRKLWEAQRTGGVEDAVATA